MRGLHAVLLAALPLVTFSSALVADLQDTLKEVNGDSLRAALERTLAPRYKEGVFEHNENAIEVLHSENPELATRIVDAAKQDVMHKLELLKRQTNATTVTESSVVVVSNTITTTTSAESTTSPVAAPGPTTTSPSPVTSLTTTLPPTAVVEQSATSLIVPTTQTTTNNAGVPTTITTRAAVSTTLTSVVVPITTTNSMGAPTTTSSTLPAVVVPTTDSTGGVHTTTSPVAIIQPTQIKSMTLTSSPVLGATKPPTLTTTDSYGSMLVLSSATLGAVITTTDSHGKPVVVTVTPGGGAVSSLVLRTTTLPDGSRSTITSYVAAGQTESTMPASALTDSTSITPTLGSPNAAPTVFVARDMAAVVGGAMGVLALL